MAVDFDVNAVLAIAGPKNLQTVIKNIQSQLNNVKANVNIQLNPRALTSLTTASSSLSKLNKQLLVFSQNSKLAATSFNTLVGSLNALGNNGRAAVTVRNIGTSAETTSRQIRVASTDLEKFSDIIGLSIRRFSAFAIGAGALASFVIATKNATKEAIVFQNELVKLVQIAGPGSRSVVKEIADEVGRLSTNLGVASADLIKTANTLLQAGLSARQVKEALGTLAATTLAPTFGDIASTTEGLIAVMNQFKLETKDLRGVFDTINTVAAKFAVESEDINTVIRVSGGVFSQLGGNVNELIALFTSVRQTTRESANTIATALKTIFARLQRPETLDQLRALGIQLDETAFRTLSPIKQIETLNKALAGRPAGDKIVAQVTELVGGIRQLGKTIPLIENFSLTQQALNVATQSQGSLTRDVGIAQESLLVKLTKLKERFLELFRILVNSRAFNIVFESMIKIADSAIILTKALEPLLPLLTTFATLKIAASAGSIAGAIGKGFLRRAKGGSIPGSGNSDTVPAMLTPGEFVINKRSAQSIGYGTLARMNHYNQGGIVEDGVQYFKLGGEVQEGARLNLLRRTFRKRRKINGKDPIELIKNEKVPSTIPLDQDLPDIYDFADETNPFLPTESAFAKSLEKMSEEDRLVALGRASRVSRPLGGIVQRSPILRRIRSVVEQQKLKQQQISVSSGGLKGLSENFLGRSKLGKAATVGGALAPSIIESILGSASAPGALGGAGAQFGSLAGGAIQGASLGSFGGPIGAVIGGLAGAGVALVNFRQEVEQVKIKEFGEKLSKSFEALDAKTGKFSTRQAAEDFSRSLKGILKNAEEQQFGTAGGTVSGIFGKGKIGSSPIPGIGSITGLLEGINTQDVTAKNASRTFQNVLANISELKFSDIFGENANVQREFLKADTEQRQELLGPTFENFIAKIKQVNEANPTLAFDQIIQSTNGLPEVLRGLRDFGQQEVEILKKTIDGQAAYNAQVQKSVAKFSAISIPIDDFINRVRLSSQIAQRRNDIATSLNAPFNGNITGGSAEFGLRNLGARGAALNEFSGQGGQFDRLTANFVKEFARRLQTASNINIESALGDHVLERLFTSSGFAGGDKIAEVLKNSIKLNLTGPQAADINKDISLGKFDDAIKKLIPEGAELAEKLKNLNGVVNETFQTFQGRLTDIVRAESEANQLRGQANQTDIQRRLFGQSFAAQQNANLFGGNAERDIANLNLGAARASLIAGQNALGAGIDPTAIRDNINELQTKQEALQAAQNTSPTLERASEIAGVQQQILNLNQGLANLANSTTVLQAAQEKLRETSNRLDADQKGRLSIGTRLAFGTDRDRLDFLRGEALVQQAVAQGGDISNFDEESRGLLGRQLSDTAGIQRFQGFTGQQFSDAIARNFLSLNGIGLENPNLRQEAGADLNRVDLEFRRQGLAQQVQGNLGLDRARARRGEVDADFGQFQENIKKETEALMKGIFTGEAFQKATNDLKLGGDAINAAANAFKGQTEGLVAAMNAFPREITITTNGQMQVIINGAETLAKLMPVLRDEVGRQVVNEITTKLPAMIKNIPQAAIG